MNHPLSPLHSRPRKPLLLEWQQGCLDHAVTGGMVRLMAIWAAEVAAGDGSPHKHGCVRSSQFATGRVSRDPGAMPVSRLRPSAHSRSTACLPSRPPACAGP